MLAMFVMCQENVLRFAAIDCSSPMSANIARKTGSRASAAGTNRPACAIRAERPAVFSATVLPPVFGPVISSTVVGGITRMSTGTGFLSGEAPRSLVEPGDDRGYQERMACRPQLEPAVGRQSRRHAGDQAVRTGPLPE